MLLLRYEQINIIPAYVSFRSVVCDTPRRGVGDSTN